MQSNTHGNTCWSRAFHTAEGTQQCGESLGGWHELVVPVSCEVTLVGSGDRPLAVRVWADLNGAANDESFGIDNVVIRGMDKHALVGLDFGHGRL